MPSSSDKPYKVYRQPRRAGGDGSIAWDGNGPKRPRDGGRKPRDPRKPSGPRGPRKKRPLLRTIKRIVLVSIVLVLAWFTVAFLSFRSAVKESNARVPDNVRAALSASDGPALTSSRNILLVGTDKAKSRAELNDPGRSDSLIIVRVDPVHRRFSMLSIPRDLQADIPGQGTQKINSAYAIGGSALTVRAVKNLTGLPIHHYAEVNFDEFKTLIDEIGGVTVDVPRSIVTPPKGAEGSFDGVQWRFAKGEQQLDGRRALAYARVRHNIRNPNESDLSRGQRQQQVIDAIASRVVSFNSVLHPRKVPHAVVAPLTSDMAASTMVAMAFGKSWASDENTIRCRLGGDIGLVDGQSVIIGDEENRAVLRMFLGKADPQKPRDIAANPFGAGCL